MSRAGKAPHRAGRSWPDAAVLLAVTSAAWLLGRPRSSRAATPPPSTQPEPTTTKQDPARTRPLSIVAVVVAVWVVLSPLLVGYPFGDAGQDLLLATQMGGLLCAVCAIPRLKAGPGAWLGALPLLLSSLLLGAVPYLRQAMPTGALAVPWWNLTLSAAALLVLASIDLATSRGVP